MLTGGGPAGATTTLVNQALQQIAYANASDAPPASVQINWVLDDGNTGAQGTGGALQALGSTTVAITAVNDAPVLDNSGVMSLAAISEDDTANAGQTVASIVASAGGDRRVGRRVGGARARRGLAAAEQRASGRGGDQRGDASADPQHPAALRRRRHGPRVDRLVPARLDLRPPLIHISEPPRPY